MSKSGPLDSMTVGEGVLGYDRSKLAGFGITSRNTFSEFADSFK